MLKQTHSYHRCSSPEEQQELEKYWNKIKTTDWHCQVIFRHNADVLLFDNNFTLDDSRYNRIASMPFKTKILQVLQALRVNSKSNTNMYISNFHNAQYNQCRTDSCRFILEVCKNFNNGFINISRIPQLFYKQIAF